MNKAILVNSENCIGCRTCEMVCSAKHTGIVNPFQSRIKIIKWERDGEGFPSVCAQCEDAPCKTICPVSAISRDEALGRVMVDYKICIGCRMCVAACPFGLIHFDTIEKRVIKCDLCDGEPLCVNFCTNDALEYVDVSELGAVKQREAAEKLTGIMKKISSGLANS